MNNNLISGVDVSHWQDGINWSDVKNAGNVFAAIKASDGLGHDPSFATLLAGAKKAGLLVFAYHFFRFGQDAIAQAENFIKITGGVHAGELPLALDLEWDNVSKIPKYADGGQLDSAGAIQALACLHEIEALSGVTPFCYTSPSFFTGFNPGSQFARFPLWTPNYHAADPTELKIPAPWRTAAIWQNTESLHLGGVDEVDGNYFLGDMATLQALVKQ